MTLKPKIRGFSDFCDFMLWRCTFQYSGKSTNFCAFLAEHFWLQDIVTFVSHKNSISQVEVQ